MQRATRGKRAARAIPCEASTAPVAPARHGAARPLPTLLGIGPRAVPGVRALAMPFAIGEEILTERKSYQVMSLIGAGEISLVVEALDREGARVVALKCLRPEFAAQQEAADHFLARAADNLALECEHLARVHEVGRLADGTPFLAIDRLRGLDLRALLDATGALLVKRATALALQLCEALATGHAAGLVHRGLRPENIVVSRKGAGELLELLEFGTSCQSLLDPRPPRAGLALRPPSYRPPEQRHRTSALDARSDIWALGCILYELLSGRAPRFGVRRAADGSPREAPIVALRRLRPELPAELTTLVARCLAQDPEQRFQSVPELADALAPFAPSSAGRHAVRCAELVEHEPERVSGMRRVLRLDPADVPVLRRPALDEPPRSSWLRPLALVLCVPIVSGLGWLYASQPPGWPPDSSALVRPASPASWWPRAADQASRAQERAATEGSRTQGRASTDGRSAPPTPAAAAAASPSPSESTDEVAVTADAEHAAVAQIAPARNEREGQAHAIAPKRARLRPSAREAAPTRSLPAYPPPFKPDPYSAAETPDSAPGAPAAAPEPTLAP